MRPQFELNKIERVRPSWPHPLLLVLKSQFDHPDDIPLFILLNLLDSFGLVEVVLGDQLGFNEDVVLAGLGSTADEVHQCL